MKSDETRAKQNEMRGGVLRQEKEKRDKMKRDMTRKDEKR